jgi:hypothetical protein
MQRLLVLLVVAVLATACSKKQTAAPPKSPTNQTTEPGKPGAAPDSKEPAKMDADPCQGGEKK